jgi:FlaA1/EpsC-like NDP-sugar epimerase
MSKTAHPPQAQKRQPGFQEEMEPRPQAEMRHYRGAGKLDGKIALISGGDSGIGRAVCTGFAKEGADVALTYLDEHEDAQETVRLIEAEGRRALAIAGESVTPTSPASWSGRSCPSSDASPYW